MRVGLGQQFCSQFWMLVERKMNPLALQTVQEIFHPDKCLINTERGAIILPIQLFFRAEDQGGLGIEKKDLGSIFFFR